ncbi:MAG: hypothetical protein ACLSVD_03475 [Eggerthellaceae bacterium]
MKVNPTSSATWSPEWPATTPKSLPRYPIVYSATDSEIVWAWSNATTRPAGAYGVALPSNDVWHVPSSNVVSGNANTFTTGGLEPGGTQSIRFQAYDDKTRTIQAPWVAR